MTRALRALLSRFRHLIQIWKQVVFAGNRYGVSVRNRFRALSMGGFTPDQYVLFDLKHNDPTDYISQLDAIRARAINSPFNQIINNSVVSKEALGHYLTVQKILARVNRGGRLISNCAEVRRLVDLITLLKAGQTLVFKKTRTARELEVRLSGSTILLGADRSFSNWLEFGQWVKRLSNWHILEPVVPHNYTDSFDIGHIPTVKIIMIRDISNGAWKPCIALHRIPSKYGRLISRIDLDTGELSSAVSLRTRMVFDCHPGTRSPIEGMHIPHWQDIKESLAQATEHFPFLNYLVYMLVVTQEGFTVVGVHTSTELATAQLWGGQRQQELGEFLKAHGFLKSRR